MMIEVGTFFFLCSIFSFLFFYRINFLFFSLNEGCVDGLFLFDDSWSCVGVILWWWWRRSFAVGGRWSDATEGNFVEDQSGRASLQTGVASLASPVAVARLAQRNVTVGVVLAQSC